ncbi:MAG: DUF3782 domain-containing protein, partial [Chthoniobacterales bacterium]
MSTLELQEIVAANARSIAELKESQAETDRQMKETDRQMKETDRKIKELGQQIGGLGNKFGSFTEGFVERSVEKILRDDFGMEFVGWGKFKKKDGDGRKHEEYDMYGYTNGGLNRGVVVEMKSKLDMAAVEQMKGKMENL